MPFTRSVMLFGNGPFLPVVHHPKQVASVALGV